jgi:hypothetical protein
MRPICLVNLHKSGDGMRFRDISDYLVEASARPTAASPTGIPLEPAPAPARR